MTHVTQDELKTVFDYKDGYFYWKLSNSNRVKIGEKAGTLRPDKYFAIQVNKKRYLTHRLVYLYHHGVLPEFLDHINGNSLDNRIENLRPATKHQNNCNAKTRRDNISGIKGVSYYPKTGKWHARIRVKGKEKYLGCFDSVELAALVVAEARDKYHKEFARHE
jgi:hypothetical protein